MSSAYGSKPFQIPPTGQSKGEKSHVQGHLYHSNDSTAGDNFLITFCCGKILYEAS